MRVLACLLAALMGIQAVERLRLADGPHGCAGRLEVRHGGRWGTVCDDGWDLRDAAVACRELGCGGALAAPRGAFFGEGAGPVWLSELACRGGEGQLGLCPHRGWKAHVCSHEEDAGVVCAGQRVANSGDTEGSPLLLDGDPWPGPSGELSPSSEEPPGTPAPHPAGTPQSSSWKKSPRPPKQAKSTRAPSLMAGAPHQERLRLADGPHGCAGRLEVWHAGRWGTVCDDGWDLRDAAVACRELGCGGALAAPGGARFGQGSGPVWMDDVGCGGSEQALRDCPRSPWGRSNCDHSEDAGLVCAGPAPRLRLADGPHGCAGRLEVWHGGRWGSVCDDAWDLRDAAVACRELGCGAALAAPGGAFFGEGAGPILLDDLRCRGNETALRFCPSRPWGQHDCHHREDAGAVCDGMPLAYGPPTVPAVGSNSSASREAASRPPPPTARPASRTAGASPLPASSAAPWEPGPEAGTAGVDSISDPFSWSWFPGLGRDPDAWLPGEPATKPSVRLTLSVPEKTTKAPGKMPKSTKKWATKHAKRPTTQAPATPTAKHSRVPGTLGAPELTSRTAAVLPTEARHRLTSRSTTAPTHEPPRERAAKTVTMPPTQDPRGMTSAVTSIQRIPPSSAESSAEIPAEGSPESSRDPGPSPTGGAPGGSGPFRVRLADGPNRCAGRLEVWHAGRWGTVCDDNWDLRDSAVACWELGCGRVRPRVGKTHYGPGNGPIWLDDMHCKGTETSLSDCPAGAWGQHNCDHEEDVGLTCTGHADEEDYPPWTWDPTSGEELTQGTTAAGAPGHTVSWGSSTQSPRAPSPATRRFPGPGGRDGYQPYRIRDTPSGRASAKGTTTTGVSGPSLTSGTTRSPGHSSPAPRVRGDAGSGRKPWPDRRLLRPTAARTAPPAPSPGPPLTSHSAPQLIPDAASPSTEVTSHPPDTLPPSRDPASRKNSDLTWTTPGLTLSTLDATVVPALTPELSPTPLPTLPKELTSDPSAPAAVTHLSPPSELTPESDAAPGWDTTPYPSTVPEPSGSPDPPTSPPPTTTPPSSRTSYPATTLSTTITAHLATALHPTTTPRPPTASHPSRTPSATMIAPPTTPPHPTTTAQLTTTPKPITVPHPVTTSHPTMTTHPTTTSDPTTTPHSTATTHPALTPDPTPTPVITTESLLTSSETELPFPAPAPTEEPSLHPQLTFRGAPHPSTSPVSLVESSAASESSPSGPSPAPTTDAPSAEDFKPPRSQSPQLTSPPPQTPHSASSPSETPDRHLPPTARPLDQPPPDSLSPGPLGPCVAPVPPVRVMACEPPALVELVAAVRDVGSQLHRLTQALERDQQERQALGLRLAQLVEAAQGLGQLGEVAKRLAEVAWPPSTPAPTATTPEEEERPLRGDV
ncbi:soluble scavenger receptor cysteine-rich domain-containing protein SSC5D isoform 2-T2 [Glossophaga mutica]